MWNFIPKIEIPIFNAGRNQANLDIAEIRQQQSVVNYEQKIQNAFKEVADALALRQSLNDQISAQLTLDIDRPFRCQEELFAIEIGFEVRTLFRAHGAEAEPEVFGANGQRMLPVPEMREVLAGGDELALATPQLEPVSSDYFDDLDALAPHASFATQH